MQQQMRLGMNEEEKHQEEERRLESRSDVWVWDDAVFSRLKFLLSIILIYFLIII